MEGKKWEKELVDYVNALSQIEDFNLSLEDATEEEKAIPQGRRKAKTLAPAMEEKRVKKFTDVEPVGIEYFMDGVQRTIFLGHAYVKRYGCFFPIQFHMSGSVIIDKNWRAVLGPKIQTKLIVPKKVFLPQGVLDKLGDRVVETKGMGRPSYDYAELRKRGTRKSSHLRDELERTILQEFRSEGFIAIDGTIPNEKEFMERKDLLGVIKTHMMRYLSLRDEVRAFQISSGYRSWLFKIERRELIEKKGYPLYSCYLKLHDFQHDPFFGLVRIEFNPSLADSADGICFSIYDERFPIQTNTTNWDRKLYPFYCCEEIIRAYLPSIKTVRALFENLAL